MPTNTQLPATSLVNGDSEDDLSKNPASESLDQAQKMKRKLLFKPNPLPKEVPIVSLLEKIPLLSGFLRNIYRASDSLTKIAEINTQLSDALETAGHNLQFTGFILLIVDFLRIPVIYLGSALIGEKPPITLSNNAQWLYSAILLGLTATALALPPLAPPIALAAASLTLAVSLFTMGKVLYQRYLIRKSLKATESDIASETIELNNLQKETARLEKQLNETLIINSKEEREEEATLRTQLDDVTKRFDLLFETKKEHVQTLYDKKFQYEHKLKKKGTAAVMDKGISVIISSIAVAGIALSLFFPPIGLGLLAASAILGALYLVSRLTFPSIMKLFAGKGLKKESLEALKTSDDHPELLSKHSLSDTPNGSLSANEHLVESTGIAMKMLFGKTGVVHALQIQASKSLWISETHDTLLTIMNNHDAHALLKHFAKLSAHIQSTSPHATTDDVRQMFKTLQEMEPVLPLATLISLLKESVPAAKTGLSEQEKDDLLACPPLKHFLHEQGFELQALAFEKVTLQKTIPAPPETEQEKQDDNEGMNSHHD